MLKINSNFSSYDTVGLFCTRFYDLPYVIRCILEHYISDGNNCHVKLLNNENVNKELSNKGKSHYIGIILLDEPSNDLQDFQHSKIPIISFKYSENNNLKYILPNPSYIGALSAQSMVQYGYNNIYYIESCFNKYFSLMKDSFTNYINNLPASTVDCKILKIPEKEDNDFSLIRKNILSNKTSSNGLFFDSLHQSTEFISKVNFNDKIISESLGILAYEHLTEIKDKTTISISCISPDLKDANLRSIKML